MKLRKRPVVQLTSLLDLLFIMIFVAMMTPKEADPSPEPAPDVVSENTRLQAQIAEVQQELEKMQARARLIPVNEAIKGCPVGEQKSVEAVKQCSAEKTQGGGKGHYRRLFVTNMYYLRGSTYKYIQSKIYSADDETGLYTQRINLTGAGVVQTASKPLTEEDIGTIKTCSKVIITRDRIYEECNLIFDRYNKIDCERTSDREYTCNDILVTRKANGQEQLNQWKYRMELVKIYDPDLV